MMSLIFIDKTGPTQLCLVGECEQYTVGYCNDIVDGLEGSAAHRARAAQHVPGAWADGFGHGAVIFQGECWAWAA